MWIRVLLADICHTVFGELLEFGVPVDRPVSANLDASFKESVQCTLLEIIAKYDFPIRE